MLIKSVVQNEADRNSKMISEYESLISELPKGSLICKKNGYYYLKYRDNGKVRDDYIGKNEAVIASVRERLALRKHYTDMLSALKQEQTAILKILEDLT